MRSLLTWQSDVTRFKSSQFCLYSSQVSDIPNLNPVSFPYLDNPTTTTTWFLSSPFVSAWLESVFSLWHRAAGAIAVAVGMHFKDKGGGCLALACFARRWRVWEEECVLLSLNPRGNLWDNSSPWISLCREQSWQSRGCRRSQGRSRWWSLGCKKHKLEALVTLLLREKPREK